MVEYIENEHGKLSREEDSLLRAVLALFRVDKQYGTFLVLLPALWTLFIASKGRPDPILLLIVVAGAFLMRSAGCAINDIADRNFDPLVERTKGRPLAAGKITLPRALIVFLLAVLFAAFLTFYLNPLAVVLSVGCLFFVILYPFTKRVISTPQLFLGIAFGWGSIIVWAAVRETVEATAFLVFLSTVTWAVAYDTIYAMMDIDDDRRIGVKSTALFFGRRVKGAVALFFALTFGLLVLAGIREGLGLVYYLSLLIAGGSFAAQTKKTAAGMTREVAFSAFRANVPVGFIILAGIVADLLI